jgi:hypothetical protein
MRTVYMIEENCHVLILFIVLFIEVFMCLTYATVLRPHTCIICERHFTLTFILRSLPNSPVKFINLLHIIKNRILASGEWNLAWYLRLDICYFFFFISLFFVTRSYIVLCLFIIYRLYVYVCYSNKKELKKHEW